MSSTLLSSKRPSPPSSRLKTVPQFKLAEILKATNSFHAERVIRKGEFSETYKGVFSDNQIYAVKRFAKESNTVDEFRIEIEMLQKYKNEKYLVSLIGKCDKKRELIIVHEFMANGTLQDHLLKKDSRLTWNQRLKICLDVAQALEFLHDKTAITTRIIHGNLNPANIWLDHNWAAKISDFGLAKIGKANATKSSATTSGVKGASSHLDPDYDRTSQLTRRTDTYAFGVVLFEVLCWRPAFLEEIGPEQQMLAKWAQTCFKNGSIRTIIDARLKNEASEDCLMEFAGVANSCLLLEPNDRPKMSDVVKKLEFILDMPNKKSNKVSGYKGSSSNSRRGK